MRLKVGLNRFLSLCALLLAVPALAASQPVSGDAVASQTVTIRNEAWAGYGVSGSPFPTPSEPKKELYKRVTGSWQMPGESEISCGSGEHSKAAFWVGLGGVSDLEQIGTLITCDDGVLGYDAVYEIIQNDSGTVEYIKKKCHTCVVNPYDYITAEVQRVSNEGVTEFHT